MKAKYEVIIIVDGDTIIEKEITIEDEDKDVIKASLIAGMHKCMQKCLLRIEEIFKDK